MYISLDKLINNKVYHFNTFFGLLVSRRNKECIKKYRRRIICNNEKMQINLRAVENPYDCSMTKTRQCKDVNRLIVVYARFLIWSYKYCYCLLWLCSHLRLSIFTDGEEACEVFYKAHQRNQRVLCLPRSIFIATTSKKFKKCGVMFIGSFFPSRRMHAWVMEDGHNCCEKDNCWINYTPLCAMI